MEQSFRQPKNTEQYGIEQVPLEERTVKWHDLFTMIFNFLVNPGMILIAGTAVASGLSFWASITSVVLGIFFAFVGYVIMATIGVDYGVPGAVATRMVFGIQGSKYVISAFRTVYAIFWFAVQTLAGAAALVVIIKEISGIELSIVFVSLIFAVLQVVVSLFGYNWMKHLSRIGLPIKVFALFYVVYLFMTHNDPNFSPAKVFSYQGTVGWEWGVFIFTLSTVAATWLSMVTDSADICRYSTSRVSMWIASILAACTGTFLSAFIGAYSAAATFGTVPNGLEGAANIADGTFALIVIFLLIIFDNWTINVLNLYTGSLSLVNIAPRLGRFWSAFIVSVLGIAFSLVPALLDSLLGTMNYLGSVYPSVAAVLITDYIFIKKGNLIVDELYNHNGIYRYTKGWNVSACLWVIAGLIIYNLIPTNYFQTAVCITVVSIGYYYTQLYSGQIKNERNQLLKLEKQDKSAI